jgi:hypothetical protein
MTCRDPVFFPIGSAHSPYLEQIGFLLRTYHPRYNRFVNDSKVGLLTAMFGPQVNGEGRRTWACELYRDRIFPGNACTIECAV